MLALAAVALFAASAGLSLYLNTPDETKKEPVVEVATAKPVSTPASIVPADDTATPAAVPIEDTAKPAADLKVKLDAATDREAKLAAWQKQTDLVLDDIRAEREALDKLRIRVGDEVTSANDRAKAAKVADPEPKSSVKGALDTPTTNQESPNILRMAAVYDAMTPDVAAKVLLQLTGTGKMDTAAKVLAQMTPAKSVRVLAELRDPVLAAELAEKMKGVKPVPLSPAE